MRSKFKLGLLVGFAIGLLLIPTLAQAGAYNPCSFNGGTRDCTLGPLVLDAAPWPASNHPGKEYSDNPDKDTTTPTPVADPEQVIAWDGQGGVKDTFDYTGSRGAGGIGPTGDGQVDALANSGDALYYEVTNNQAPLLFSVSADGNIYYERTAGGFGTWATPAQIDQHGVSDVDGLEVWGSDVQDDSNRYSLATDPAGIAVYTYNPGAGTSGVLHTDVAIAAAIAGLAAGGAGVDPSAIEELIDLDAMMTSGSNIMFSIAPLTDASGLVLFDGGEIFLWSGAAGAAASFLFHGGHLWDTAFGVASNFGLGSENINALEAATATPEPATLLLLGTGLAGLGLVRRRRQNM